MPNEKTVVGLYVRVSTQEQAREGYSIGEQKDRLEKYAEAHGWIIHKIYSDPGFSGGSMNRPGLKALISDTASGKINKVIVYKLDRLSRSQKDTLYLIEDIFLANEVDFVSMTENFDTGTPLGRAMIGILSVFAQLEREQIKERMSVGRDGRAKTGLWGGGAHVPIGYRYTNGKLIQDPFEAEIVRRIFHEYLAGRPITSIVRGLKEDHITTIYGPLSKSSVRHVLECPIHAGYITHNGTLYPGQHEAIIDKNTWDQAQVLLEESARTDIYHFQFHNRVSIVTGLCYCGECGQKMVSRYWKKQSTGETIKNIVCPNKTKTGCKTGVYKRPEIERIVLDEIKKLQLDPEHLKAVRSKTESADDTERIALYEERIRSNDTRISRYMDLYALGGIDLTTIKEKIEALTDENEGLKKQIEKIKSRHDYIMSNEEIEEKIKCIGDYLDEDNIEQARKIVTTLIKRIDLLDGDTVTITWSF